MQLREPRSAAPRPKLRPEHSPSRLLPKAAERQAGSVLRRWNAAYTSSYGDLFRTTFYKLPRFLYDHLRKSKFY